MVFHGDYEAYYEIHEKTQGDWRSELLGYMAGVSAEDARSRWLETYPVPAGEQERIIAVVPFEEWK
jgi:hypothetical protein